MQSLDIISVNVWQMLISLLNLVLLFFILKKFLYSPVTKVLKKRRDEIQNQYSDAKRAKESAEQFYAESEQKLNTASARAEQIIKEAADTASARGDEIVQNARDEATGIIRQAEAEAKLEIKRTKAQIKNQIVDVSTALSEKMLGREINSDDHKALIDSFIKEIGEENDSEQ